MSINSLQNFAGVRMEGLNYLSKHATPPSVTHTNLSSTARVQASKAFNTSLSKASSFAIQYVKLSDYKGSINADCHVYGVDGHEDVSYIVVNSGSIVWVESSKASEDEKDYKVDSVDDYVNELTDDIVDAITSAWEDMAKLNQTTTDEGVTETEKEETEESLKIPTKINNITHHAESRIKERFPLTSKFSKDKLKRMVRDVHMRSYYIGQDATVTEKQRQEVGERYEFISYLDGIKYIVSSNGTLITVMPITDISEMNGFSVEFSEVLNRLNERIHEVYIDGTAMIEDIANKGRAEILKEQFAIERKLIDLKENVMENVLSGAIDNESDEKVSEINRLTQELEALKEQDADLRKDSVNLGKYLNTYVDFCQVLSWEK